MRGAYCEPQVVLVLCQDQGPIEKRPGGGSSLTRTISEAQDREESGELLKHVALLADEAELIVPVLLLPPLQEEAGPQSVPGITPSSLVFQVCSLRPEFPGLHFFS